MLSVVILNAIMLSVVVPPQQSHDTQHNDTPHNGTEPIAPLSIDCNSSYFRDAECHMQAVVMLSVITTSAVLWDHIFFSKFI